MQGSRTNALSTGLLSFLPFLLLWQPPHPHPPWLIPLRRYFRAVLWGFSSAAAPDSVSVNDDEDAPSSPGRGRCCLGWWWRGGAELGESTPSVSIHALKYYYHNKQGGGNPWDGVDHSRIKTKLIEGASRVYRMIVDTRSPGLFLFLFLFIKV